MPTLKLKEGHINYTWINETADNKPVIVFLHEGLGSIQQWKTYPQVLCERLDCKGLIYDRVGHGDSSRLAAKRDDQYLHNYALDELPQVLEGLLRDTSFMLYGHSDGGSISLIYAGSIDNANLCGVITEAAHVFVEDITLEGITPVVEAFEQGELKGKLEKYHGEKTTDMFYAWSDTWFLKKFRSWNIEELLPHISVPVLAIQGEDDEYGSFEQLQSIKDNCQNAVIEFIPECAHSPFKQAQESVLSFSSEFYTKRILNYASKRASHQD